MNKQKPVWRMNTGQGVPSDLQSYLIDKSGIKYFAYGEFRDYDSLWTLEPEFLGSDVAAYETTRTKAAKYERVKCPDCGGLGGECGGLIAMDMLECEECSGKGYRLEAIK